MNENGLATPTWTVSSNHQTISEGAVVGIVFGWIILAIGLYIVGMVVIAKCLPQRKYDEEEEEKKKSKESKDSKDKSGSQSSSEEGPRKRRLESNPTLELIEMEKPSEINTINLKMNNESES